MKFFQLCDFFFCSGVSPLIEPETFDLLPQFLQAAFLFGQLGVDIIEFCFYCAPGLLLLQQAADRGERGFY